MKLLFIWLFCSLLNASRILNERPVIGVLTQDIDDKLTSLTPIRPKDLDLTVTSEFIAASYIKFIESGGARAVAIRYTESEEEIRKVLSQVNGVLFPGGDIELVEGTKYFEAGKIIWDFAQEHGNFPLFGICLGFEHIASAAAGVSVLAESGYFNTHNIPLNLKLNKDSFERSDLFKYVLKDKELVDALKFGRNTFNEHKHGITVDAFKQNLQDLGFDLLATSFDVDGKEFVAAYENKERNVFGTQFHPEKNLFEWHKGSNFPKTNEAMRISQSLINSFVEKARKNTNKLGTNREENDILIENEVKVLMPYESYFQEIYVFFPTNNMEEVEEERIIES